MNISKQRAHIAFAALLMLITLAACSHKQTLNADNNNSKPLTLPEASVVSADMIKKPYLLYSGDNTEMTILWQLDKTLACAVNWGLNTNCSGGTAATNEYSTGENGHQHKHTISNLKPATKYYYKITAGNNEHTGSFMTAPATNEKHVKFMAYGDSRTNTTDHNSVAMSIVSNFEKSPEYQTFILHTGDWISNGNIEADWNKEYFSLPSVSDMLSNIPVVGCIGNHEGKGVLYDKYWPYPYETYERYWSFDYGPAHITIIAHTYETHKISAAQLAWIEQDLKSTDKPWKFVVFHAPGYSAGGHANSLSVQNDLQPLLERYDVDIAFNGHNHFYSRADVNGVMHVTAGGGGAPLYSPADPMPDYIVAAAKALHYCKIEIQDDKLLFQAIKPDGTVIDEFLKSNEPPLLSFGVLADAQYADKPNGSGRFYRDSLVKMQDCVNDFNNRDLDFVIQLGDLIDEDTPQWDNLNAIIPIYNQLTTPKYHVLGNHDFWRPDDSNVNDALSAFGLSDRYYDFTYNNWQFIVLDTDDLTHRSPYYDFTANGKQAEADQMWNSIQGRYNGYNYNGGVGDEQLTWLENKLDNSTNNEQKVIVLGHMPLHPENNHNTWNDTELIETFESYGCVVAYINGHNHAGNYGYKNGTHYLTLKGIVETALTENAYAVVEIYKDYLRIDGFDREPDRILPIASSKIK